jgi:hypothetical protein
MNFRSQGLSTWIRKKNMKTETEESGKDRNSMMKKTTRTTTLATTQITTETKARCTRTNNSRTGVTTTRVRSASRDDDGKTKR